jgi:hypothetical protein
MVGYLVMYSVCKLFIPIFKQLRSVLIRKLAV